MSSTRVVSTSEVMSPYEERRAESDEWATLKSGAAEVPKEDVAGLDSSHSDSSSKEEAKTKPLCDHFKRGKCRLENSCRFAHSLKEHSDPSLIAKRRAEAKAQQKLLKLRKREAEKSAAQLTSAGDTDLPSYGLPKRASTGSLPSMAVPQSPCYAATPEYYVRPQQQNVAAPTGPLVRRSASCSMVQTPTFHEPRMYLEEEHYED
ncbi:hypothetical protein Pmar_PMAR012540 [Perkinsus marinus ATCC 50983]|uniref:C3H1-type domain-containing protein n=1 Tax=Perkinsus marinus (strain ATCC 50983 / TXsc) TaxID=423536 RepID=C5K7M4_PERM5|nr:hypothetical protein Pmar_PMAR012540 [Perkinsus marinus ATCC 50983]EER19559.1 hypothetical protein Pmar_PMAR012540 [Perkinsus marinus ATCC 50983]|eukprot:XP_002787763.1 hypothetical protein Pmar_PMAR012540 [Perkinsus marinus ATCC 50983]